MPIIEPGDISPRIRYLGDGINKSYSFNFLVFEPEDVEVYFDNEMQSQGFDIIINNKGEGGAVNFDKAPAKDIIITIIRNLEIKRKTDFSESKAFRAKALNHEFDYQVSCLKQIVDNIKRTVALPVYSESNIDLRLPIPNAGKALMWDEEECRLKNSLINIEDLDIYAKSSEEAQRSLELALETSAQVTTLTNDIAEASRLSQENAMCKLNLNLDNINNAGKNYLKGLFEGMPTLENKVGKIVPIKGRNPSLVAPAGGTWFYTFISFSNSGTINYADGGTQNPDTGIVAGGTVISSSCPNYAGGFFWRIA